MKSFIWSVALLPLCMNIAPTQTPQPTDNPATPTEKEAPPQNVTPPTPLPGWAGTPDEQAKQANIFFFDDVNFALHDLDFSDERFGYSRVPVVTMGQHVLGTYFGARSSAYFGNGIAPLTAETLTSKQKRGWGVLPEGEQGIAKEAAQYLLTNKKEAITGTTEKYFVEARAIKLDQPVCISCHTDSKVGDVVSVLFTAIPKERVSETLKYAEEVHRRRVDQNPAP